jgi:broad specificity phosphatase PhoE
MTTTRTQVHLVRHGEVHNPGRILYGRLPGYGLSELGREMARLVATHLSDHDVAEVVASPLQRARETAVPIAEAHGLVVGTEERAVEADNVFEGRAVAGGKGLLRDPSMFRYLLNPTKPSWGEPYQEIADRMISAIGDLKARAEGREIVLVSHQAPIWIVRCALEGRRLWHDPRKRECTLASVTTLVYEEDRLESIGYAEPAAALLAQAAPGAGA